MALAIGHGMSNHLDLLETRKVIEAMSSAECWRVQQESMADAGNYWKEHYGFSLLGAVLIYGSSAADVMEIRDVLSAEEASTLQGLGTLVQQKWRRGQRGEADPSEEVEEPDDFVVSELIEEVLPLAQAHNTEMALGVKAWKANQAHRQALASAADSSSGDVNVLAR